VEPFTIQLASFLVEKITDWLLKQFRRMTARASFQCDHMKQIPDNQNAKEVFCPVSFCFILLSSSSFAEKFLLRWKNHACLFCGRLKTGRIEGIQIVIFSFN